MAGSSVVEESLRGIFGGLESCGGEWSLWVVIFCTFCKILSINCLKMQKNLHI